MKKLVSVACLVLLTACSGGGGSGVEINAEPDRPVLPEVDVAAVQQLQVYQTQASSIRLRWRYPGLAHHFEVYRDGQLLVLQDGNLLSYQDQGLDLGQHYQYQVVALNASGQRSEAMSLTARTLDNQPPQLAAAPAELTLTSGLAAGQMLHQFRATDADGHALSWQLSSQSSSPFAIDNDGRLTLTRSATELAGRVFRLAVEVSDGYSVRGTDIRVGFIALTARPGQTGVLRQVYQGQTFTTSVESLLTFDAYPDSPSSSSALSRFKAPSDEGNNYGQRLSGYLIPAVSGDYRFWIASDDASELRLSTTIDAADATTIARVSGWVGEDNWDSDSEQQSASITLQAGEAVYIEALMVEVGGGDHLSVAWQPPGGQREIIPAEVLRQPLDNQAPQPVTDLRLAKTADDSVLLEWTAATDNVAVAGYEVWHGSQKLADVSQQQLSSTDLTLNNLHSATRYDFYLVVYDAAGNRSVPGNIASVMISDYVAPQAPQGLSADQLNAYSASLSWSAAEAGLLYHIYLDDRWLASSSEAHYLLRQLTPGQSYRLRVHSVDAAGNVSADGAELSITTPALDPQQPDFGAQQFFAAVSQQAEPGQAVFRARAGLNSANDDPASVLNYRIVGGNDDGYLAIDSRGVVSVATSLTAVRGWLPLTIEASASDNPDNTRRMELRLLVLDAARYSQQGINQQVWSGIAGGEISNIDVNTIPAQQALLSDFSTPADMGNNYGQRLRGFLRVPQTGEYNFWVASDDHSELRLSRDMDPAKSEPIARVNHYTGRDQWSDSNRVKTNLQLQAGQLLYIEALHKEGGGGDHLSVAWQGPGISKRLLTGQYLLPYSVLYPSVPLLQQLVQSGFDQNGEQLTLTLDIPADAAGLEIFVYYGTVDGGEQIGGWQKMLAAGALAAGVQQLDLPGIVAGERYYVRLEVRGPAGSSWSAVVPVSTQIIPAGKQAGEALPATLNLTVEVDDESKQLSFYKHSVRSPNYQLLTFDNRRQQQYQAVVPMPEVRTYRGVVENDPYQVVTGVIDADGQLHISAWRGDARAWGKVVSVADQIDAAALGNSTRDNDELIIARDIPATANNRLYVPQPGVDFHNNLARVSFKHEYSQFVNQAKGQLLNSIAQMENHINETDYVWAQKTGLRWDLGKALIELHGDSSADNNQPRPAATDATNFSIEFQDPVNGGYCWGGGDWVGCVANFTHNWGFTHEIGHNMGLGHGEQTDNNNQIQNPGTHMGNMQARKTTARLQSGSKFKPAKALTDAMPPAAFKDYLTVYQNNSAAVAVLANDYDANGERLNILAFDSETSQGGRVSQQGDALLYTPPQDFIGVDQFRYTVTDGRLHTVGPVQIQVLRNGLSGDWDMETINAEQQVVDASGDGNHLTAPQLASLTSASSLADSRESSADNHAMTLPLMAAADKAPDALGHSLLPHKLDPGHKSFSASLWLKTSELSGARLLMGKSSSGPNNMAYGGWEIRSNGATLEMQVNFRDRLMKNNQALIRQENALSSGVWHHVVMVIDREQQQLRGYLNGVAIGAAVALPAGDGPIMAAMNSSGYGGGSPFRVGGHAALQCSGEGDERRCQLAPGQAFDNVRVYHKALSEAEIQALSQR